ncbi:hypothetical protein BH24ACT24_BH24ACT24_08370 [soil metagenome]
MAIYSRPSLTWEDLPFLRERTRLPIVLKGILNREDAERALDHGMDGIVVSNHGGRQVDGAIATLDAARDPRGGRRRRAGAARQRDPWSAPTPSRRSRWERPRCCSDAPTSTGSRWPARPGVREVIQNVVGELDLTLGLAGGSATAELDRGALVRA